jgi:hypothetical protein
MKVNYFLILLNLIIVAQITTVYYSFFQIKNTQFDVNEDGEKAVKLSLTGMIILSICFILINGFYLGGYVNTKRTILNCSLIITIGSVFLYINYLYLYSQMKTPPGYNESENTLFQNSDNTNQNIRNLNLITSFVSLRMTLVFVSFFIGYKYFSRTEFVKIFIPILSSEKTKNKIKVKRKLPKLKLF